MARQSNILPKEATELTVLDQPQSIEDLDLKPEHLVFLQHYTYDWGATRAYQKAYPNVSYQVAGANATRLLKDAKIQLAIKLFQNDLERTVGISKQMVLREEMKIAFSSIAHLHNTWIDRKSFEELTEDQKACIQEIDTKVTTNGVQVKVKLYDKQKSLEAIRRMLGYNEEKSLINGDITINNKTVNQQNNFYSNVHEAMKSQGVIDLTPKAVTKTKQKKK